MASDSDYEALRKELNQVRSDIAALASTLKDIGVHQGGAAYERAQKTAQKAQEKAAQTVDSVGQEISEKPFTSVLGAFSVGLLIGVLFSRRS